MEGRGTLLEAGFYRDEGVQSCRATAATSWLLYQVLLARLMDLRAALGCCTQKQKCQNDMAGEEGEDAQICFLGSYVV